jgi:hypothetical protein
MFTLANVMATFADMSTERLHDIRTDTGYRADFDQCARH